MKRAFEVKETFFLVSQQLSFRLKKQTCKNVVDTTFICCLLHRRILSLRHAILCIFVTMSTSWSIYVLLM